jgi:hypothetical protein
MKNLDVQTSPDPTREMTQKFAAEILTQRLDLYCQMMNTHPLFLLVARGDLPRPIVDEFAWLQYADSILWVPMLALMKERVRNPRLVRALTDNIACEAGVSGTSHIELARRFVASLGLKSAPAGTTLPDVIDNASQWTSFTEGQIAGWICAAETLVPILFSRMRPAFAAIRGCDLHYLDEHIGVDSDEHSKWMQESIEQLVAGGTSVSEILAGLDFGMREAMDVPDMLYAKAMWLRRA